MLNVAAPPLPEDNEVFKEEDWELIDEADWEDDDDDDFDEADWEDDDDTLDSIEIIEPQDIHKQK